MEKSVVATILSDLCVGGLDALQEYLEKNYGVGDFVLITEPGMHALFSRDHRKEYPEEEPEDLARWVGHKINLSRQDHNAQILVLMWEKRAAHINEKEHFLDSCEELYHAFSFKCGGSFIVVLGFILDEVDGEFYAVPVEVPPHRPPVEAVTYNEAFGANKPILNPGN